jgi:hypothetical protein
MKRSNIILKIYFLLVYFITLHQCKYVYFATVLHSIFSSYRKVFFFFCGRIIVHFPTANFFFFFAVGARLSPDHQMIVPIV